MMPHIMGTIEYVGLRLRVCVDNLERKKWIFYNCQWSDFDQTLWTQFLGGLNDFVNQNIFVAFLSHFFFNYKCCFTKNLLDQNYFWPKVFGATFFVPKILGTQYCFGPKIITSTKITMNKNDNHNHNFDGFWHNWN